MPRRQESAQCFEPRDRDSYDRDLPGFPWKWNCWVEKVWDSNVQDERNGAVISLFHRDSFVATCEMGTLTISHRRCQKTRRAVRGWCAVGGCGDEDKAAGRHVLMLSCLIFSHTR